MGDPDSYAYPTPGTERTVAVCVNCRGEIERTDHGWRHVDTKMTGCS